MNNSIQPIEANSWKVYEIEKRHLQSLCLTPDEYEKALRTLAKKLNL